MRTGTLKAKITAGFTLIELTIVLAIISVLALAAARWMIQNAKANVAQEAARQMRLVADAGLRYTMANSDSLKTQAGPSTPVTLTTEQLSAASYLPPNTANTNPYGQTYEVLITKDAGGNLLPIAITLGGQALDGGTVRQVAEMITADGGAGGFIANAANDTPGPSVAVGHAGWQVQLSNYGVSPGPGHFVDAIFFSQQSSQTNVDLALHRVATAGEPQYNQMQTAIDMQNNNIIAAGDISGAGNIGTHGMDPKTGLPAGWSGGVHTWDIYGEGTFGMGTGGTTHATIGSDGNFIADGWYRSNGNTGWYSQNYGGGVYMQDANWVRIYNDKGLYTGGQIQAGTMVSVGRMDAKEYLQVDGTANAGWSCSPNGLIAQASDGSGMIQCKLGVWTMMQGLADTVQAVSPGSSCGFGGSVTATCPVGYKITGGGYYQTRFSPLGQYDGNAPGTSAPSGNGWVVAAGNQPGNTCFAAYAVCGK